jgi:class 3 adenylate cyclase
LLKRTVDGDYDADAFHRLELIRFAGSRGIDEQQLAGALTEQGDLLTVFDYLSSAHPTELTRMQAATEANLDVELVASLSEILGWDPNARATNEDVEALHLMSTALQLGLAREPLTQLLRVYADLLDRLADAEVRIFHDHVHEQFRASGLSGQELLDASQSVGSPLLDLVEPAITYFHRRAFERANQEDLLRHLMEPTTAPASTPGESEATVMFIDLAGFTPLTVAMGDTGAADLLRRFAALVRAITTRHAGRIIKQIGDAFMVTFLDPCDAVRCGIALLAEVRAEADFPALHVGAHHGRVLFTEGDYVGGAVNLAARVAAASGTNEFLITRELFKSANAEVPAGYTELPGRALKGIADPVVLVSVSPGYPPGTAPS